MCSASNPALISLCNVRVSRGASVVFPSLTWQLHPGTHWAVVGPNGAGKSTFFKLVAGELGPDQVVSTATGARMATEEGTRVYHFDGVTHHRPVNLETHLGLVSPEMHEKYMVQGWKLTGREAVATGFFNTPLLYTQPAPLQQERIDEIFDVLQIADLADRMLPTLSQGQLRKILIGRGLASGPKVLLLDEVCQGLDEPSRASVLHTIDAAASLNTHIVFSTHRYTDLPSCITHVLALEPDQPVRQGNVSEMITFLESVPHPTTPPPFIPRVPAEGRVDAPLFELHNCTVSAAEKILVQDIDWTVCRGQQWGVLGPNGAGKTTLLKLVLGDVPPHPHGSIRRHGLVDPSAVTDFPPEAIIRIRRNIGLVSADLQAAHGPHISAFDVVLSGFSSSIGYVDAPTPQQQEQVYRWLEYFGLTHRARTPIGTLSHGQVRRLLLARALVAGPELLILDEPCTGLDTSTRNDVLHLLSAISRFTTIINVTHHHDELLPETTHILHMNQGRIERIDTLPPSVPTT